MGKSLKLVSFSFFIHPFSIGFGIHDVLRSWIKKETKKSLLPKVIAAYHSFSYLHALFILLRCDKRNSGTSFIITAFRFVKLIKEKINYKKDDGVDDEISFLLTFFFVNKYNFVNKKEWSELLIPARIQTYWPY